MEKAERKRVTVYKVTLEFVMVEDNLWDLWDKLNKSELRPFRKIEIREDGDFEVAIDLIKK